MLRRQREIFDADERRAYINDIQRYLATQMYIVPYVATPGVYAYNRWVHHRDFDRVYTKATLGFGQEFVAGLWLDQDELPVARRTPPSRRLTPTSSQTIEARIAARRLADGRIEFALRPAGSQSLLPRGRFLPANPRIGAWLQSTPVLLEGNELGRIRARRLADGRTEFGYIGSDGLSIVPRVRFFPADAPANSWLQSSLFEIPR